MTEMTCGIVTGYDGSPGSGDALRWAAREAKARDTTLTVCLAWMPDWTTPGILEAVKPGRMQGHGGTAEVSGGAA